MATIAYSDVRERQLFPIDARDICTKVTLVVAGRPSGVEAVRYMARAADNTVYTHFPTPIVVEVESDDHNLYYAHKVIQLTEGSNPFLDPTDPSIPDPNYVEVGPAPELRDGDPDTNVVTQVTNSGISTAVFVTVKAPADAGPTMVGFRLMYSYQATSSGDALTRPYVSGERWVGVGGAFFMGTFCRWDLPFTNDQPDVTDLWATAHVDGRGSLDGQTLDRYEVHLEGILGEAVVTHFYPLVLNTSYLESIARSHLRSPAATPSRVTVAGVVPQGEEHTIVGWPGGDLTIREARRLYRRDETIIDVEQRLPIGVSVANAEAELIRRKREADDRHRDLYPVRMAAR